MELKNKTVIVTGAGKGMGRACAERLAKSGSDLILIDKDERSLVKCYEDIKMNKKCSVTYYNVDVSIEKEVERLFSQIIKSYENIDGLVNCAGIQTYGTVEETAVDDWDKVFNINVKSIFLMSKYAIPLMKNKKEGASIVNISSVQAFSTQKSVAAYSATKGAINTLTKAMAVDHAVDKIRVNAICPGSINTPMLQNSAQIFSDDFENMLSTWGKMHPLGRIGEAKEVAEVVLFLISSRASFVTGSLYTVDGGLTSALGVALPE